MQTQSKTIAEWEAECLALLPTRHESEYHWRYVRNRIDEVQGWKRTLRACFNRNLD